MLTAAIVAVSCTKEKSVEEGLLNGTNKSISANSIPEDVLKLNGDLIERLKKDPDFKSSNMVSREIGLMLLQRERGPKRERLGIPPKEYKEKVAYLKAKGIQDPVKYLALQVAQTVYYQRVAKKFPELLQMDRKTRSQIMTRATGRSPYAFRKKFREIIEKRAKEKKQLQIANKK